MIKIGEHIIQPTLFPDGTSQVWKIPEIILQQEEVQIVWEFQSESEIIHLSHVRTILERNSVAACLYMPFLPYGRQDKTPSNNSTFGLHNFGKMINAMNFYKVSTLDVHSVVAKMAISKFENIEPRYFVGLTSGILSPDLFCYPDKGARNKYSEMFSNPYVYADKVRDQTTGQITSTELHGHVKDKTVLIVDDICDGGATFIGLAEKLYSAGATEVYLYVTHGIFSKGLLPLFNAKIKRIFTYKGEQKL